MLLLLRLAQYSLLRICEKKQQSGGKSTRISSNYKNNIMAEIHIPDVAPEVVGHIGNLAVTNTMVNASIATLILLCLGLAISFRMRLRPGKLQNTFEFFLELLFGYFDSVTGSREKTLRFLPLTGTMFFFILLSNWLGLMPGTGSILAGHLPLLRPASTDLNLTVAMALIAVISSHLFAFASVGIFTHLGKFIQIVGIIKSIPKGPIAIFTALVEFVVGIIEIISEAAKVLSLSLRLFGNVFAGEVLLSVMSALVGILVPAPFYLMELLVGLVQAAVFTMLTLVYLTVASEAPHGKEAH